MNSPSLTQLLTQAEALIVRMNMNRILDAIRNHIEQWERDAEGCDRDGYTDAAIVKRACARDLRAILDASTTNGNDNDQ